MLSQIRTFFLFFCISFIFFFKSLSGDVAFITNQESNMLDIIDLTQKKNIKQIKVGEKPAGIAIDKINKIVFVSNPESNNISKINLEKNVQDFFFAGNSHMSLYYAHQNKLLYVTNWYENKISVVNTLNNKLIKSIDVGKSPAGIFVAEDLKRIFVANKDDNTVSVVDTDDFKILKNIHVGKAPYGVFSSPKTEYIFITNVQSHSVTLINKKTLKVEKEIKVGKWPYQIAYNKRKQIIYVTNQRDNSISVIDLKVKKVIKTMSDICEYPEGIDISYNQNLIVVACWFEDNIILIDLNNEKLLEKIGVSGGPRSFGNFILN